MKIKTHLDLPPEKDIYIGSKYNSNDFCNRYRLRSDGNIEIQHIYRYAKPSKTTLVTKDKFNEFINQ